MEKISELFNEHEPLLTTIGSKLLQLFIILIFTSILLKVINILVERLLLSENKSQGLHMDPKRAKTLTTLLKSVLRYLLIFLASAMILGVFGINLGPLLAAAGLASLAVGFGAQNLVRDIITGFFILLEDQFNIGDYVTIVGVSGIVEEMGLRTTLIRDFGGEAHVIPNGEIKTVTNHMGDKMRVLFNVRIGYEEDINRVIWIIQGALDKAKEELPEIVEGPNVLGLQDFGESGLVIGILAKTVPLSQWKIGRELRKRIKETLDEYDIQIPYPRQYVIFDRDVKKEDIKDA